MNQKVQATSASRSSTPLKSTEVRGILWPALLLVISGTTALIYQVLWIKQLTLMEVLEFAKE